MYHYIRVNPDPLDRLGYDLSVTPADFRLQMDWLAANGYHPIDFEDLRGYLLGHGTLPARPVVITLDDGYRDLYTTAYPVLREHDFKAVAYIVSGFLGSSASVSQEQVQEMDAHGIQIGSHTVSHPDLTKLPAGEVRRQLADSKSSLEALLGHPVVDFCYPAGATNQAVQQAVQAAGYQTATTTAPGTLHAASDRYAWSRVRVSGGEPLSQFVSQLGPEEPTTVEARPRQVRPFIPTLPPLPAAALGLEASPTAQPPVAIPRGVTP
jgi:peptidoglycan/xylan/chitin deacetylase (PgdA/CDA1 family)